MEAERELKTILAAVEGKSTEDLQLRYRIVFINAYLLPTMLLGLQKDVFQIQKVLF